MENRFKQMREELDSLGYFQKLVPESMPLVQKLLLDLYKTSENLQKYMKISQCALEERDLLESGVEPYKCDNARLIKECNELHQAFIHFKEQHEKNQKGPKVGKAKNDISSNKGPHKGPLLTKSCSPAEEKVKDLEEKHLRLTQENTYLKNQVETRDKEVERLHLLLEGGRPYEAVTKDCCYKNIDNQMTSLQDEITRLNAERNNLQAQLKEAVAKQHEAMRRALHLVERNRQLEKEMKNVDEIALAVEAECKSTVRGNSEKVIRLQDRINESLILIQNLERDKRKLAADLDSVMLEKSHLEGQLQSEQDANKKLTDRINCLVIIENDLNLEIDRLTQLNAKQKRNIMELESRKTGTFHREDLCERVNMKTTKRSLGDTMEDDVLNKKGGIELTNLKSGHKKDCKKSSVSKSPTKNPSVQDKNEGSTYQPETGPKCCCESGNCIKNLRDLLDREVEFRQVHAKQSVEDLRQEKEYYMKEYQRLMEQMRNVPRFETSGNEIMQLKQQLNDKEHQINQLEENLRRFKIRNSEYIINGIQLPDSQRSVCSNINCKNKERELEVKSKELNNLEIENNSLKTKLQAINESTVFNEERIKRAFKEMQEHIQKLEDERRDLVKADLTQRSNISELENHYRSVKDQHKQTQMELNNLRANYNQLKLLQEQNDRALTEAQAHVLRAETDLAGYKSKIKESSNDTLLQDREIARLTSDIQIMKNQLIRLDKEKDSLANNLDEKTEKIASLEDDLGEKTKLIARLETELKDLNRKLSKRANETSSQDQLLRAKEQEIASLEQDHEKEKRLKEAALVENKRLQNDLSSVVCDCREARNELDITKRQVEDLKRQLQHYVAEIKRTEDLISQKELERSELLDQFKSLSQEANELESNNHTLETEATQSKIQLSVALDHTSDLERKIQHQESVIKSYEKQIAESSENVARLEMQLKQNGMELEHCSSELKQMRDLCVKLDREKDVLKSELTNREDRRSQAQKITEKLSSEKETLQKVLEQEKTSLEMVEKLLSDTRRDLTEQRLLNQDMQREISRLKQNISELEERLTTTSEQLDIYQGKAFEYSQQNKQLRRDIANERFSRSRLDDNKGYYPSL
ncbi:centrosomal protein of 135 kDa isoform X2 [Euwallacea fornicatus]|uniref:centrosomal protein of 135 kDa isoform X2 n=1 Tax=Euwallacea fornicatus TaxID=995702 RepID=UPI00338D3FE9